LQQRLARKEVPLFLPLETPVAFIAYDLLLRDGRDLLDEPIEARRAELGRLLATGREPLLIAPQFTATSQEDLNRLFDEARARGNEGLVLKRRGSRYEAGRRGGAWLKWKQPLATLDVVITAAEQGHGKRATVLSDYTFAVRAGDRFVNVGKAYSGLTDEEIRELTERLRELAVARAGPVLLVRPEIVLEVAFNGVQKSARHESGFALRFPRIVRWRRDKRPDQIDDLDRVREIYEKQALASQR
jgi:DNA ligase-1